MKISMLIVMFLLIGAFFIISNNNLNISKSEDATDFSYLYTKWFGRIANNTISSVGYVIKMHWLPEKTEVKETEKDKEKKQEEKEEWID